MSQIEFLLIQLDWAEITIANRIKLIKHLPQNLLILKVSAKLLAVLDMEYLQPFPPNKGPTLELPPDRSKATNDFWVS